jgi:hypothetical protein
MIVKVLQMSFAAGVVDFNNSHNAASAEDDPFLRDDLKDLKTFLLKRLSFFIDIKVQRWNKSTTPAGE